MLRALLRIMKRSGVIVGLFAFLTVGAVFPGLLGCHERGAVTVHHHSADETAAIGHDVDHSRLTDHAVAGDLCGGDCCAPGCCALIGVAITASAPLAFESGRMIGHQDRRADGLTPLTIERPPRA